MNFLKLIISFWREALIVILLGSTWYFYQDTGILQEKLRISQEQVVEFKSKSDDLQTKVDLQVKATIEQTKLQEEQDKKRLVIISNLQTQVNKFRNQNIPTECNAAIVWSIENKADLQWQK